jgi:hypothetical protein
MPEEVNNNYDYVKYIKTPKELGIKVGDSLSNVENGVAGIFSYVKLLVEGKSNASKTGEPLGNKYFLETEQNCINQSKKSVMNTNQEVSQNNTGNGESPSQIPNANNYNNNNNNIVNRNSNNNDENNQDSDEMMTDDHHDNHMGGAAQAAIEENAHIPNESMKNQGEDKKDDYISKVKKSKKKINRKNKNKQ